MGLDLNNMIKLNSRQSLHYIAGHQEWKMMMAVDLDSPANKIFENLCPRIYRAQFDHETNILETKSCVVDCIAYRENESQRTHFTFAAEYLCINRFCIW